MEVELVNGENLFIFLMVGRVSFCGVSDWSYNFFLFSRNLLRWFKGVGFFELDMLDCEYFFSFWVFYFFEGRIYLVFI